MDNVFVQTPLCGQMATALLLSSSPPLLPSGLRPLLLLSSRSSSVAFQIPSIVLSRPLCLVERKEPLGTSIGLRTPSKRWRLWKASASSWEALAAEAVAEKNQEIVPAASSTADGGIGSFIISGLLTLAFVGLSVLTAGVIYIAVTDFLQKREREKFEKEEDANKKKKRKKEKVKKPRTGPRGFG